jgi:transposase InsO family protein
MRCVYLHAVGPGPELRAGLNRWIGYYNADRPHSALEGRTPDEAYEAAGMEQLAASQQPQPSLSADKSCPARRDHFRVDWFNHRRLLEPIGNIPPAEAEAAYHAALDAMPIAA